MPVEVRRSSDLAAPADAVWMSVTTLDGVVAELRPWLRMTAPRGLEGRDLRSVPVGEPLGRSWLLLFGVLPVEYDDLCITQLSPGHFVEESQLASARAWRHERTVESTGPGCRVTDRLTVEPRRLVPPALVRVVVGAIFSHRHRRLRRLFGAPPQP